MSWWYESVLDRPCPCTIIIIISSSSSSRPHYNTHLLSVHVARCVINPTDAKVWLPALSPGHRTLTYGDVVTEHVHFYDSVHTLLCLPVQCALPQFIVDTTITHIGSTVKGVYRNLWYIVLCPELSSPTNTLITQECYMVLVSKQLGYML